MIRSPRCRGSSRVALRWGGGEALTWIGMVQTVSGNLGTIFAKVTAEESQLIEDPVMYKDLMVVEWGMLSSMRRLCWACWVEGDVHTLGWELRGESPSFRDENAPVSTITLCGGSGRKCLLAIA